MILADDLVYADIHEFMAQLDEVSRMLDAYIRTIEGR
jgi:hypothetical protein